MLSIDLDIGNVVLENSWDIDLCTRIISLTPRQIYVLPCGCGGAIVDVWTSCRGGRARLQVSHKSKGCVEALPLGMCLLRKHCSLVSIEFLHQG